MKTKYYILNLRLCGIKNITEPIEIAFCKKTINNSFDTNKYKIKAIYGENGSGKTAVITAVKIFKKFITDKDYLGDINTQKSLYEIVNKKTQKGFIESEFLVVSNTTRYIVKYSISFEIKDDGRCYISGEKLEYKTGKHSNNKYVEIFTVADGVIIQNGTDARIFDLLEKKTANLLTKQSLVASSIDILIDHQLESVSFAVSEIVLFMVYLFANSISIYIDESDDHSGYISRKIQADKLNDEIDLLNRDYKKMSSLRIFNSEEGTHVPLVLFESYKREVSRLKAFISIFKPELNDIEIVPKLYDNYYVCRLNMVYDGYTIDKEFESRGIRKLMELFNCLDAASKGGIVFIDELDANINDIYLDKLIEFFQLYGTGQLCFTAHNLSPMALLKKNSYAIDFISSINTVHTWTRDGNLRPDNAYKNGFIEDSPFNVDASDFIGILGGEDE